VLNVANEIAVARFLANDLAYMEIANLLDAALQAHTPRANPSLEEVEESDAWARTFAQTWTHY
jgi:1-deoxy-D-xylulose-5-phosphate reductoisomerase